MTNLLLKQIKVADPQSNFNKQTVDILVMQNKIVQIGQLATSEDIEILDFNGLAWISPGWIDTLAYSGEPGEEYKEDLISLSKAAKKAGFTSACVLPGPHPSPDNGHAIKHFRKQLFETRFLPLGYATQNRDGLEMAEIYDMFKEGAIGFFDGDTPLKNNGIKQRLLQYTRDLKSILYLFSFDKSLAPAGMMHEGKISTSLGMKGIPSVSEYVALQQDLALAEHECGKVFFPRISSKEGVELIRNAKKRGTQVFAGVPVLNLAFTDEQLIEYHSSFKVLPPLRTEEDRIALWDGLLDGTLDAICSNHVPQDIESKELEFEYAQWGAATLDQFLPLLLSNAPHSIQPEMIANWLHYGPSRILQLNSSPIEVGNELNATLFNLDENHAHTYESLAFNTVAPAKIMGNILHVFAQRNESINATI